MPCLAFLASVRAAARLSFCKRVFNQIALRVGAADTVAGMGGEVAHDGSPVLRTPDRLLNDALVIHCVTII